MAILDLTPPTEEPVTVEAVRAYQRLDASEPDAGLQRMIASARAQAEAFTGLRLMPQFVRLTLDGFPPQVLLPVGPVRAIEQIQYVTPGGAEAVLDPAAYQIVLSSSAPFLVPSFGLQWPVTRCDFNVVKIDVSVGYASGGDVPPDIVQAILLLVGHQFEHRSAASGEALSEIPIGAKDLLMPHRVWS